MKAKGKGTIVNVSSGIASFGYQNLGPPSYRLSKAALNMITVMLAAELKDYNIAVNAVCPGWVATRMGGIGGRPVKDGAAGIIWAATLPDAKVSGQFFRDGQVIAF
jgi:NAD(P)-dependent dehydrogenase (short-subunit alcohol dehydrogenase family)